MRTIEELMESTDVQTYIQDVKDGRFDIDEEIDGGLETNWLESEDMHGDGEYVVNSGDYMVKDGLTEQESYLLWDGIIGKLQKIKESQERSKMMESNRIECPLCGAELEYRQNKDKAVHSWVCSECPMVMFEFYKDSDYLGLGEVLQIGTRGDL